MAAPLDHETLLKTILEGIAQPFYAVDREWRITLYNSDAARHFGKPPSEVLGRKIWELYPDEICSERGRILLDAMARRSIVQGEARSIIGRWVSYCMFPLGDGLGIVFHDVTDRRQAEERRDEAEEALRKRTAQLEAVLETIPVAVWFTSDGDARHVVGNRRAADLLRLPRSDDGLLATPFSDRPGYRVYRNGEEVAPQALPLHRAVRGEQVSDEVLEFEFENGDRKMLLWRAAALRGSDGEIQGAVCAAADVTERHRYEDHLRLMLNELNHRVKNTLAIV